MRRIRLDTTPCSTARTRSTPFPEEEDGKGEQEGRGDKKNESGTSGTLTQDYTRKGAERMGRPVEHFQGQQPPGRRSRPRRKMGSAGPSPVASDEQVFPDTTLLPWAEQIKAMEAKMSRAKARSHLPAFDFKRNRLDMSRMRVRRFLVEEGGSVDDALDANSSVAGSLADGSVITSVVDVKLPRYNEDKKGKGSGEGEDGEGSTVISDLESVEP